MTCQNCKHECSDTATFCRYCGHKLINTCPNCQQAAGAVECLKCGYSFIKADVGNTTDSDEYRETRICTKCGKQFTKSILGIEIESPEPDMCDACRLETWAPFHYSRLPNRYFVIDEVIKPAPHSITIPASVSIIYDQAFMGTDITEVKLPRYSHIVIGNLAFANCKNLEKFDCANSCVYFAKDAFLNCEKLDMSSLENACRDNTITTEIWREYRSYKLKKELSQIYRRELSVDDFRALSKAIFDKLHTEECEFSSNKDSENKD